MTDKTAEMLFADALALFQKDVPAVKKGQSATVKSDKGSYQYSYADLTDITEVALPLLAKHGLSWTACPTITEHGFVLRYALVHTGGHREGGEFPLADPSRSSAQQIGSWLTYARRYALCAVTGIAPGGDDDDAQKAGDARASDIAVRDPGRTRGKTERRGGDPTAHDEFTTDTPRTTDVAWFAGIQARLDLCGTAGEVNGLITEARDVYRRGRLSAEDAATWKDLTDARLSELGQAVAS